MKWILSACLLLLALPCSAKELGFDAPKKIQTHKLGLSQSVTPPQAIRETCWAYDGSALVWQEDPGLKGIETVSFRQGKDPMALCAPTFSGASRTISLTAGWPLGVVGNFLFVQDEPLGNLASFDVFDLNEGKKIFSSMRDTTGELRVEKKTTAVSLSFLMGLEVPCVPVKSDSQCWEKIKNANHIPTTVAVAAPDCEAAFRKEPSTRSEPRGLAISAPAQVPDLAHPQIVFQPGSSRCEALP